MSAPRLLLASASPRRRELLQTMGLPFEVVPSRVDEDTIRVRHPRAFALQAALAKAMDVAMRRDLVGRDAIVVAADTVVALGDKILGKPADEADARRTLGLLSGQTHTVITALAVGRTGRPDVALDAETTRVTFRDLTEPEIAGYVATGEPLDKAGSYGIQGEGGRLVEAIAGDYFNVVGLPCARLARMLEDTGEFTDLPLPETPERWRR